MVTIIDYGIGNLRSMEKAIQSVGVQAIRTDDPDTILKAKRLILPGVGAFGACADEIRRRNLEEPILEAVHAGIPLLGVCVGMQILFEVGEELGLHRGLGILPGRVIRFEADLVEQELEPGRGRTQGSEVALAPDPRTLKIPHMGWNSVRPLYGSPLLEGIDKDSFFYFVHSYHAAPEETSDILATTEYGITFPSIVGRNNVFGVQFHPEKSQRNGLRILSNFSNF